MRIVHLINALAAGGAEVFVASLAAAQAGCGHEVTLFTYAGILDEKGEKLHADLARSGVAHHSVAARSAIRKLWVPADMARHIAATSPAVVHAHLDQSELFLYLAARLLPRPLPLLVRTLHLPARRFGPFLHSRLNRFFDRTVACGTSMAADLSQFVRHEPLAIDNGITLDGPTPDAATRTRLRTRLNVTPAQALVLSIGSFALQEGLMRKGQDVLIEALARTPDSDVIVVFAGDGVARAMMEEHARARGVIARCRFVGRVPNVADYIVASDIVAMPSRLEGLPIAAIEAACLARPLLVSDLAAFTPFLGPATVVTKTGCVESLSGALTRAAEARESLAVAAAAARDAYRARFDIAQVARRYVALYRDARDAGHEAMQSRAA